MCGESRGAERCCHGCCYSCCHYCCCCPFSSYSYNHSRSATTHFCFYATQRLRYHKLPLLSTAARWRGSRGGARNRSPPARLPVWRTCPRLRESGRGGGRGGGWTRWTVCWCTCAGVLWRVSVKNGRILYTTLLDPTTTTPTPQEAEKWMFWTSRVPTCPRLRVCRGVNSFGSRGSACCYRAVLVLWRRASCFALAP
jgi:hypothetical protein